MERSYEIRTSISLAIAHALCGGFIHPHFNSSELVRRAHVYGRVDDTRWTIGGALHFRTSAGGGRSSECLRQLNRTDISQEDGLFLFLQQLDDMFIPPRHFIAADVGEFVCGLITLGVYGGYLYL